MTIEIPAWVARDLGIAALHNSEGELREALEIALTKTPVVTATVDDLVGAITAQRYASVELLVAGCAENWRFAELYVGGSPECQIVEIGAGWSIGVPTNSVRAMLSAWMSDESLHPARVCENHAHKAMIGWFIQDPIRRLGAELSLGVAGLEIPEARLQTGSALRNVSRIEIPIDSWVLDEKGVYGRLIQSVFRQRAPGLRFLYLYRLFERAYLNDAFKKLGKHFFEDPKGAIRTTENAISNERSSLLSVVEGSLAEQFFVEIENIFISNKTTLANRFLIAIHRSVDSDGDLKYTEAWKRGCVLVYKIRCSIVHSGTPGPIFESFPDASAACEILNEKLESAAVAFLRISVTT